jgi:methylphosphotriester-DNA--protein-cysteine methyltransferase
MHQVGILPKQYQKAIQLNLLKDEIVRNKQSNITECIIESGMESHSLVSKNFKSYFKMTPSEFKNATRT